MGEGAARLPRASRLGESRDFQRLGQRGTRRSSRHFVTVVGERRPVMGASGPVLGITVSKKVGTAVQRNRVKRRIREWFRRNQGAFSPDLAVVVIARRGAAELGTTETERELRELVQ